MKKLLIILLLSFPILSFSQNYEKEGDDLFAQAQYEQAEKKYKAAIAIVGETPSINQKLSNCSKCKTLLSKAQTAEKESRYNDGAKFYSNLYEIHPLAKYKSKENAMKQKARQEAEAEIAKLEQEECDVVFMMAESMPEFPGGQDALDKFLSENVKYPIAAQENGFHGRVICQFIVNKAGLITEVEVVSGGDPSLKNEAVRVIQSMPRWKPGKSRGKPVCVKHTLAIKF